MEPKVFDEFWELYPRKMGRFGAMKALERALQSVPLGTILAAVRRYAASAREERFIKSPERWLNEGCWDDQPGSFSDAALYARSWAIRSRAQLQERCAIERAAAAENEDKRQAVIEKVRRDLASAGMHMRFR
jgi:hypothetical protein